MSNFGISALYSKVQFWITSLSGLLCILALIKEPILTRNIFSKGGCLHRFSVSLEEKMPRGCCGIGTRLAPRKSFSNSSKLLAVSGGEKKNVIFFAGYIKLLVLFWCPQ